MAQLSAYGQALNDLPDLVLLRIADFLVEEDIAKLSQTCRRLHALLPRFLVIRGRDFSGVPGSGTGWGNVEKYFDGPRLPSSVLRLTVSVLGWQDQGWGNQKGELFARLMRGDPHKEESSPTKEKKGDKVREKTKKTVWSFFGNRRRKQDEEDDKEDEEEEEVEGEIVAERRDFFSLAGHEEQSARLEMDKREKLVSLAQPGDWYRFMRRVGGGGGHTLTIRGFKAILTLNE